MDKKLTTTRRAILLSARMRFSPETQPIRETAIDRFIEYSLLAVAREDSVSARDLEKLLKSTLARAANAIGHNDIYLSLERLVSNGRVEVEGAKKKKRYKLAENTRGNLGKLQSDTDARLTEVCERLFPDSHQGSAVYKSPFMECLSYIFSQLGETYVHQMLGDITRKKLLESPSISTSIQKVLKKYHMLDSAVFAGGVIKFFGEVHPDFNAIKWNMAQSYYIAFTLGLDGKFGLLSHDAFGNATFYLDTNVLIHALEPAARHYGSFQILTQACRRMKTQMCVCQVTLDELRSVIVYIKLAIPQIAEQVPEETAAKIRGVFYQLYNEELRESGEVDIDKLFAVFDTPNDILFSEYDVQLVDDHWFNNAADDGNVKHQTELIQKEYQKFRNRKKPIATALHDAILTEWIKRERSTTSRNVWVVTLDRSLPLLPRKNQAEKPLAITLDALLQWISPVTMSDTEEDNVAQFFAEAVKYQLLPSELQFEIRDFHFLLAVQWQCKNLPAEDVEGCIQYLRVHASELDPNNPFDLQKIAREISRFMADPSRKYKGDIEKLEETITIKDDQVKSKDDEIRTLEAEIEDRDKKDELRKLRSSATKRLSWVTLGSLAIIALNFWIAGNYGNGQNWWQKVGNLYWLPTLSFPFCIIIGGFIIGKRRLRALGWPFDQLFKAG